MKNFQVCVIIAVVSMFLTSIYLTVKGDVHYSMINEAQANKIEAPPPQECPIYVQPKLPPLPKINPISDEMINDRKKAEDHMLAIIKEHRAALVETNKLIEASYQDYVKNCLKMQEGKTKQ